MSEVEVNANQPKRSLFVKRTTFKPYEYPSLIAYKDAIRHSYWLHTEFNYDSDIQDYKSNCTDLEKEQIKRAMLAIAQIEVNVKRFWADFYYMFPKPEIDMVGVTFGDSELRHMDAYSNLLELLGFNDEFLNIQSYPALQARTDYTTNFLLNKSDNERRKVMSTVLFSMFIEHISLFSQFLFIMSFNKEANMFKGMSNAIEATSKEEEIHGNFGVEIYNILKEENPEIFTQDFYEELEGMADEAFKSEMDIVDWIYSGGENQYIKKEVLHNYLKHRYNRAFKNLGLEPKYVVDMELYKKVEWFDLNLLATVENDFFYKRSTDYSKRAKSITEDELF